MSDYLRSYIPGCPAFGWTGGPVFSTRIRDMSNGRERRNAMRAQPRHSFTLPFQNIRPDVYTGIKQFHLTCMGMLRAFLYRDPSDHTAENQAFGVGNGSLRTFQLSKLSVLDGVYYQRNVYALPATPSDLVVTINGTPTAAYTVDRDRGLVTFNTPPAGGAVLAWSGTFDLWVRFNQDSLPFSIDNKGDDEFFHNGQVDLIEVAPPAELVS